MALQGKIFKFCNIWSNSKNLLQNTKWCIYPIYQQIAGLRQTLEAKYDFPPKPKRPLTPYFKFMAQLRPQLKLKQPNAKATDLVRQVAAQWEKADAQTKSKLEAEYKKEHDVYTKVRLEYDTKLTDEQKQIMKQARIEQIEIKEKRKYRKKRKDNNKPKKPCSAFVMYMKTQLPGRGNKDFKTFQKDVAASWFALSEADKKPFVDQTQKQMKEYQKQMVEWERQMIKLGNTDIVRFDALLEPKPHKGKKSE